MSVKEVGKEDLDIKISIKYMDFMIWLATAHPEETENLVKKYITEFVRSENWTRFKM
jgi:hypothetical protein